MLNMYEFKCIRMYESIEMHYYIVASEYILYTNGMYCMESMKFVWSLSKQQTGKS